MNVLRVLQCIAAGLLIYLLACLLFSAACLFCIEPFNVFAKQPQIAGPKAFGMALPIYATGQDQTQALQAAYDAATDGDIPTLISQGGKAFVISGTVNWAGGKQVCIEATNATISGGTNAAIVWGAALGSRTGNLIWHGGKLNVPLVLQNIGYSRIEPQSLGAGLIIQTDTAAPYNTISAPGGIAGNGVPAIQVRQLAQGAWANFYAIRDTPIVVRPKTDGSMPPIFAQTNHAAQWRPGAWLIDHCDLETPSGLFDGAWQMTIANSFFEPANEFTLGTLGQDPNQSHLVIVNPTAGLPFLNDRRVSSTGVSP